VATLVLPLLIYPAMMLVMSEAMQVAKVKRQSDVYKIAVIPESERAYIDGQSMGLEAFPPPAPTPSKAPLPPDKSLPPGEAKIVEMARPKLDFSTVFDNAEDAQAALKDGRVQAVLSLPPGFHDMMQAQAQDGVYAPTQKIELFYDEAEHRSQDAKGQVLELLNKLSKQVQQERMQAQGVRREVIVPFDLPVASNVASNEKVGGAQLGAVFALIFTMMVVSGAMHPAIDLTAGEKERSTLETLVSAPVRPLEIIAGKFMAVAALGLIGTLVNVSSFALSMLPVLGGKGGGGFSFPWSVLPVTLLLLIPLAMLLSAMLMAVASFGTNYKEASVYCLPITLIPMVGLMIVIVPGIGIDGPLVIAPVLNVALLIRELFLGRENLLKPFLFVFTSTCFYAAAAVFTAARVFAREEVLFSAQGSLRLLMNRRSFRVQERPSPGDALLAIALVFPLFFYFSTFVGQVTDIATKVPTVPEVLINVCLPQFCLLLGGPILLSWYLRLNFRETFKWNAPSPRALLAALCLGASSWILANQLAIWMVRLLPAMGLEDKDEQMSKLFSVLPPAAAVFCIAITPAICEEHLFRGFLLSGLRTKVGRQGNKWTAIIVTAFIFAAYHGSFFRFVPLFLVGFAITYLAWQSNSIFPGVLVHGLHNGFTALCSAWLMERSMTVAEGPMPFWIDPGLLIPALVVFVLGIWLAKGTRPVARAEPALPNGALNG